MVDVRVRFRSAARYEDLILVRCWVRDVSARRVIFGYAVELGDDGSLLATAETSLMAVNADYRRTTIPEPVRQKLIPVADPVRI